VPGTDQPFHDRRFVAEAGHVRPHRREIDAGGFDGLAELREGRDQRAVTAAKELARHGDVRVQVAERSECREYDALARHVVTVSSEW
jgi:hypothetical protein